MLTQAAVRHAAHDCGFEDVGFTTADPFDDHRRYLADHQAEYGWAEAAGLGLLAGTDPHNCLGNAQSVIVLLDLYFRQAYPRWMEGHFGRCYLDDDRVTKDGLSRRIKAFRTFLGNQGLASKVPANLPHRMTAVRAGMGTLGRNGLFYAGRAARQSSWVLPIPVVVDHVFEPDPPPAAVMGCPDWCRNACIAACPTRALKGNGAVDPRRCISFLTYFGQGLTPRELRAPMGTCIYGCDRCQNVCPRNAGWLAADLPENPKVAAKAEAFRLPELLRMDGAYFLSRVWPHMFYMGDSDRWRWQMNTARAMGNTRDPVYLDDLATAMAENPDERVRCMAAWALGRIGGPKAKTLLEGRRAGATGELAGEIDAALAMAGLP
jgi:epoxyqueuosine reductase